MPLTAKLRDLQPDEIDLVQLVHNYGVVHGGPRPGVRQRRRYRPEASPRSSKRGYLRQF